MRGINMKKIVALVMIFVIILTSCTPAEFMSEEDIKNDKLTQTILKQCKNKETVYLTDLFTFDWDTVFFSWTKSSLEFITGKTFGSYRVDETGSHRVSSTTDCGDDLYLVPESSYKRATFFKNDRMVYDYAYLNTIITFGSYSYGVSSEDCMFSVERVDGIPCFYYLKDNVKQDYEEIITGDTVSRPR